MAQRFGGKHSPGGPSGNAAKPNAFAGKRRSKAGSRVNFLFLAPLPLIITAFWSEPVGMALDLVALATLLLAAWLTREGLEAEDAYLGRRVARRPAFPRKIFGSALTGIGMALAGFTIGEGFVNPLIFGLLGAGLHAFSFGLDPMSDKGMEGIDTFQQDRVARAIDEAESQLKAMSDAMLRVADRPLTDRVNGFQATAREMFRTIEDDPRDLTAARKFLSVYLVGAKDATVKFVDLYTRNGDQQARADYEALLDDLEQNFAARTEKLLLDDRSDLDIEIEVLRDRLQREGVRAE
ncbi:5-bromo-4-chloroindolyl phosphate hydrolysis family protein [Actibacterium sp. 188UL27-1]|uniref:5-bromo-4-chloroindolyl phosphate hydrolysis family protein n=1 Tax=Actibacterium sp. 188UL27-1 TaxID=2786961 RepID=UPI00195D6554|nr:5-bromo-4-chloroindolyl phosphate hydrolysis family protein [Actibacterium sp. 188UL27-1]